MAFGPPSRARDSTRRGFEAALSEGKVLTARIALRTKSLLLIRIGPPHKMQILCADIYCFLLVSGAKPRTPKGSSRTAQGASPGFKVRIAESPERAVQGVRSQLQINARHKAPLWYRDQLHRPFGASVVTVLVPRACALGFPESPLRG